MGAPTKPKPSRLNEMLADPADMGDAFDLFRDRKPVRHEGGGGPEDIEPVDADDITSDALREALLCSIGSIRNRARNGASFPSDAASLEKLMELVKDFPQLSRALEDVQDFKAQQEAMAAPQPTKAASEKVRKLRAALDKV